MDKHASLVEQLNQYRPDMKPCSETAVKERVDAILLMVDADGVANIDKLVANKIKYALEHPESYTFRDLAQIAQPAKTKTEVDAGGQLLNLFARFAEKPAEVVDMEDKK